MTEALRTKEIQDMHIDNIRKNSEQQAMESDSEQ